MRDLFINKKYINDFDEFDIFRDLFIPSVCRLIGDEIVKYNLNTFQIVEYKQHKSDKSILLCMTPIEKLSADIAGVDMSIYEKIDLNKFIHKND